MPLTVIGEPGLDLAAGDRLAVSVPASTSNLGPAMDGLGMSVPLRLEVAVAMTDTPDATGHDGPVGTPFLRRVLRDHAPEVPAQAASIRSNPIPVERGLGGSGAVRLAALLVGAAATAREPSTRAILELASRLEGHPDNVTSSMLGGVVASMVEDDGSVQWVELGPLEGLEIVVAVPTLRVATARARGILPDQVPHGDARYTAAHTAMLVAAIAARRYEVLAQATKDRIHQPYRLPLVPGATSALEAAMDAGAMCAFLSGSGSTLAALAEPRRSSGVAAAMVGALDRAGTESRAQVLPVDGRGAEVVASRADGSSWSWTWGAP